MSRTIEELEALVEDLSERVQTLEGRRLRQNRVGPHVPGSGTSKAAAISNYPRSGSQRALVLEYLQAQGPHGATRQEIAIATGLSDDSVRPRVVELIDGGWVLATERTRTTPMGEQAEVLIASARTRAEQDLKTEETRMSVSPSPVAPPVPEEPMSTTLFDAGRSLVDPEPPRRGGIDDDWDTAA